MKRFLLLLLLAFSIVLVISCNDDQNQQSDGNTSEAETTVDKEITSDLDETTDSGDTTDSNDTTDTDETTDTGDTTVEIPKGVAVDGKTAYTVIRPETASSIFAKESLRLYSSLRKCDSSLKIINDTSEKGSTVPECEIIFGDCNRQEVLDVISEVPYCGFAVKAVGAKLVVIAGSDEYTDEAVDHVISLISDGKLLLDKDYFYSKDYNEDGYPLADAELGGHKLSEYSISSSDREIANLLQSMIGEQTGMLLHITKNTDSEAPMLVINSVEKIEYYEYSIELEGKNICFSAYGYNEYGHAFKVLIDKLEAANGHKLSLTEIEDSYKLPSRETYINDPSKLYMLWDHIWEAPEWMLDYEAKKASLFGGNGTENLYASAHRAENIYYPENSIEAIISAYYMGATIVELDISATKDGVLVLMHDGTLTRTTNASEFIGKAGYPNSANVSDWTYEQLKALNLKEAGGGNGAAITPFKIPTLEEALTVCKNRLFIVPDKPDNWQYVRSDNIMQSSNQIYLSDVMKKTENFESILISYGKEANGNNFNVSTSVKLQKLLAEETGAAPYILFRSTIGSFDKKYAALLKDAAPNSFMIQIRGDFDPEQDYASVCQPNVGNTAFLAWTIDSLTEKNDFREMWEDMYGIGIRVIMTNNLLSLMQYCAEAGENKNK